MILDVIFGNVMGHDTRPTKSLMHIRSETIVGDNSFDEPGRKTGVDDGGRKDEAKRPSEQKTERSHSF
jgi:hypothetical protein